MFPALRIYCVENGKNVDDKIKIQAPVLRREGPDFKQVRKITYKNKKKKNKKNHFGLYE